MTVRKIALRLLLEYESSGKYVNLSLSSHLLDGLSESERGFVTALFYTAVEHKLTYDYYIGAFSGRSPESVTQSARNILRLGMAQLLDMDNIPDFAAVNETVKLARDPGERSFVNGILRRTVRERDSLPMPDRNKNLARYLSVKYSFPQRTVKLFLSLLGEADAERLLVSYSSPQPTDLTVNTTRISVEDYRHKLELFGYTAEPHPLSPITLRIKGSVNPRSLPGFSEGEVFVQDAACAAAIAALAPKAGDTVIDVCSAPGGKSFTAAVLMGGVGSIHAFDLHESKLSLISGGAVRLGLDIIKVSEHDSRESCEELLGMADKVICDVPCSGLGVLGKKPDLRYKDITDTEELCALQYSILNSSAKYLKRGGVLLYSTCTLNGAENGDMVARFLAENEGYRLRSFTLGGINAEDGMLTLYPHLDGTDGFFISLIEKEI